MPPPKDPLKYKIWQQKQSSSHKEQVPWNKGKKLNKLSEEHKQKIKISNTGKKRSKEFCKIMQLQAFKRKYTKETRQKLKNARLGKKHTKETLSKMSASHSGNNNAFYGKKHTDLAKHKISESHKGENSPSYIHGECKRSYCYQFTGKNGVRERSLAFFNNKCIECNKTKEENKLLTGKNLNVHHVYYRKMSCCENEMEYESGVLKVNNKLYIKERNGDINEHEIIGKPEKFAVLCSSCHTKTTTNNRYFWIQYYEDKINKLYNGKSFYTKEEYEKLNII